MALSKTRVTNLTKKFNGVASLTRAAYKDASPQQKKVLKQALNKASAGGSVLAKCPKPGKKACSTAGSNLRSGAVSKGKKDNFINKLFK